MLERAPYTPSVPALLVGPTISSVARLNKWSRHPAPNSSRLWRPGKLSLVLQAILCRNRHHHRTGCRSDVGLHRRLRRFHYRSSSLLPPFVRYRAHCALASSQPSSGQSGPSLRFWRGRQNWPSRNAVHRYRQCRPHTGYSRKKPAGRHSPVPQEPHQEEHRQSKQSAKRLRNLS